MSEKQDLNDALREQLGIDPSKCDPVTLELFKSKFFGSSDSKKQTKAKKKEKSKMNNIIDKHEEDQDAMV